MKNEQQLNITFHNPNTEKQVADELIKIFAEIATARVKEEIKRLALKELKTQKEFNHIAV